MCTCVHNYMHMHEEDRGNLGYHSLEVVHLFFLILEQGFSLASNLLSRFGQLVPVSPPQGSSFLGFRMYATVSAC